MAKYYTSVEQLIGNTPLLNLKNIQKEFCLNANLFAKLECFNPAGSVKDRVAKQIILDAQNQGKIDKDTVIIEPTSGNTGIGLASLCANIGYKLIIVMPDSMSIERIKIIKAFGAQVVLTDGRLGMQGAIDKAHELNKEISNSFIAGQFINPSNPKAHRDTTGKEIYADLDGEVDFFVAGIGTGGTITGVGEYLKSVSDKVKIIGVEPKNSAILSGGKSGMHKIQGIGAGFVPQVLNERICDQIISVSDQDAYSFSRLMAVKEGVLVGISSGCALAVAIELAKLEQNKGKNIVVLMADSGERYLSTDLY